MLQMMPQTILQTPVQQQAVQVSSAQPMLTSLQPAAAVSANHLYNPAVAAASSPAYTMLPTGEIALANSHLLYYPNTAVATTAHQMSLASPAPQVTAITSHMGASRADRLEVCRDFLRGNCTRGEHECRYAHPDDRSMIDLTDNSVTVCMDCIKGRCTRDKCKYFHPPPHLQAKIRASQHQAAYLPIAASPGMASPQPPVVSNNNATNALGQPPIKRHALDNKILTQQQATISGTLVPSTNATQTLYGNYGLQLHQAAPQFYHQLPMLSMYGGASPANLQTPTALSTVTLPTANGQPSPASSTLALLNGQSQQPTTMETLTVCRDYQSGKCTRPVCRFVHVTEDFVEIKDDKVAVCKNALLGKCNRPQCRFYHYPTSDPSSYISPYTPSVHLPPVEAMTPPNSSILCSQTATAVMMDPQTTVYAHPVNRHTPVYTDLPAGI